MKLKHYLAMLYARAFRTVYLDDVFEARREALALAARLASIELKRRVDMRQVRRAVLAVMEEKSLSRLRIALPYG